MFDRDTLIAIIRQYAQTIFWVLLILVVIQTIAWARLFRKANEKWWKALIPIYNSYVAYKIAGRSWFFTASILISLVEILFRSPILAVVCNIGLFILSVLFYINLSKAFGKEGGFVAGLLFLYPLFILILAFDDSEYCLDTSVEPENTWICPRCGVRNPRGRAFCQNCNKEG